LRFIKNFVEKVMKITYYGHACFAVEVDGKTIVFDPFISGNPLAKNIQLKNIKADYILISHGHEDHTADAIELARLTNALVVSNFEICNWVQEKGINRVHAMNIGGHYMFDFGKLKCVNAIHSSSMPDGSYGGSAMGFLLETEAGNVYYSGDTALSYDMKLIGDYKRIDICMLPIGSNFTMGIDNAIIASEFVKCDKVIGMHYDTFPPIRIDHQEAKEKFTNAGKDLLLMKIGETITI